MSAKVRRVDTSDMGSRDRSHTTLNKMPVDETTTLDGTYRIESILDSVVSIRRHVTESSEQSMIIQMLLD